MKTEPWMRGVLPGIDPVTGHLLRAAEHIREDVAEWLAPLAPEQIWAKPCGMTSAGFHAKHLAGSTQRLCTYLEGAQLSAEQLAEIPQEATGTETAMELIAKVNDALARYESVVRALRPEEFAGLREIGRKKLPATVIGLAIHIAEHGQRHAGQMIAAVKLCRVTPVQRASLV